MNPCDPTSSSAGRNERTPCRHRHVSPGLQNAWAAPMEIAPRATAPIRLGAQVATDATNLLIGGHEIWSRRFPPPAFRSEACPPEPNRMEPPAPETPDCRERPCRRPASFPRKAGHSHTISPSGVIWKNRPSMPSSISVLPLGRRCALLTNELKKLQTGRPESSPLYCPTISFFTGSISRTRDPA